MRFDWRKRLKDWGPTIGIVLVVAGAWRMGWIPSLGGETNLVDLGQQAVDFAVADVHGGAPLQLSAHHGEVVLVNFWATWCPPCRMEIPAFAALYGKYQDKGFTILGLALDQGGVADVLPFVNEQAIPYPVGIAHQQVVNDYGGIRRVPTSFLIDRQGRVVKKYVGLLPGGRLERDIQALL